MYLISIRYKNDFFSGKNMGVYFSEVKNRINLVSMSKFLLIKLICGL